MSWINSFYVLCSVCQVTSQQFDTYTYFLEDLDHDFMTAYGFKGNDSWYPNSTITKPCAAFLKSYAEHTSVFTKCLVENARPFRLCETCVKPFKKAITVFEDMNDESNPCFKRLLGADRVQVIRLLNNNMQSMWKMADCKNCFSSVTEDPNNGTVNVTVSNSTEEFQQLFHTLGKCMNDTIENPDENGPTNVTVCTKCRVDYRSLNKHFESIQDATMNHACMDVVDMMNYTRLIWSDRYNCTHRKGDDGPVLGVAIVICLLPIVFYVCHRVYGNRYPKQIVQRKKKNASTCRITVWKYSQFLQHRFQKF
ncbi:osteopetrosis-associated transmembrane protein 1-like isoform X2 [Gigantopelta aegis]|uniref:osteopetrosis-associated transmembrane protein 1-like isoform X2 n=1 Tax=Gigantopelta aegis TaxID=1735272 RepID=UPI001B889F6A|nr:osteopetrosis-associated transmembrane protein 1-like isoform X2 [Gigantopelta aegis]